jgi:hypothetical protein
MQFLFVGDDYCFYPWLVVPHAQVVSCCNFVLPVAILYYVRVWGCGSGHKECTDIYLHLGSEWYCLPWGCLGNLGE